MRLTLSSVTTVASHFLVAALLVSTAMPVHATDEVNQLHRLDHLDESSAEALVLDFCDGLPMGVVCNIRETTPSQILVTAKPEQQARIRRLLGEHDIVRTRTFQVVVVRASAASGEGIAADVPANVHAALQGLTELLPFGGFELVDAGVLNTTHEGTIRLAGSDGETYRASLNFHNHGEQVLVREFQMSAYFQDRPSASAPSAAANYSLAGANGATTASTNSSDTSRSSQRVRQRVVSTNLGLQLGQTMVVGTAKLGSADEPLVVLLTALPEVPSGTR